VDLINIRAGLIEYILQTQSTTFVEDSILIGRLNPNNSSSGCASARAPRFYKWLRTGGNREPKYSTLSHVTEKVHPSLRTF